MDERFYEVMAGWMISDSESSAGPSTLFVFNHRANRLNRIDQESRVVLSYMMLRLGHPTIPV